MDLTTGYPYSLIKAGLPWIYPKLEESVKTEILILGGGISGALTAYYLVNAGLDCILVDARTIGLGSTCASTSLLQYELDMPLHQLARQIGYKPATRAYEIGIEAIDELYQISRKIKFTEFYKRQSLYFAHNRDNKKHIATEFLCRKEAGFRVDLLSEKDIINQFGFSAPAAILSHQAAATDAYTFTHALLKAAIAKGLKVFDRTCISHIEYKKKGVNLSTANGHKISAGKIVNATGYEVTEFIDKKIVKLSSTYAIASEHIQSDFGLNTEKPILWNTADPYLYIKITEDNRIIVGGRDEDYYNPTRRDKLIKKKATLLEKDFNKLFPLIEFIPEFRWTGTFGSTKDSLPYIGLYDKTPHTYYALGFGGNGITFSAVAAKILCDMIGGKPNKDASLFAFER